MGDRQIEIRDVLTRYCMLCDDGRFDEWAELFTLDARFAVMGQIHEGRVAIQSFIEAGQPPERRGRHAGLGSIVDVDHDGVSALAWTDFLFVSQQREIKVIGRYHDELALDPIDGEWRFILREIVFLGAEPTLTPPPPGRSSFADRQVSPGPPPPP